MRNIKLIVEYDGSRYFGFQRQRESPTVQELLELAGEKLLAEKVKIRAAGRTDRGVHALGQVVSFKTSSSLPLERVTEGLNFYLPKDIAVRKATVVPPDFHPQYSARAKTYRYTVLNSKIRSPLGNHTAYHFPFPVDWNRVRRGAKILEGRHDFRAFHAAGRPVKNTVRTIYRFSLTRRGRWIHFTVTADGFLYKMMRNMVGTLLWLGTKKITIREFRKILQRGERTRAGPTVPPEGLTLVRVDY